MLETKAVHKSQEQKKDKGLETAAVAPQAKSTEAQVEKSPETRLSEALTKGDGGAALQVLEGATPEELASLGGNETLMLSIVNSLKGASRDNCMDAIYEHVTSVAALTAFVEKKYGVKVGSGTLRGQIFKFTCMDQEAEWTPSGLKHLYYSLSLLPKSHVNKVSSITTENSTNGSGGFAVWAMGSYNVNYTDGKTDKKAGYGYCDGADNYKFNLNSLNSPRRNQFAKFRNGFSGLGRCFCNMFIKYGYFHINVSN